MLDRKRWLPWVGLSLVVAGVALAAPASAWAQAAAAPDPLAEVKTNVADAQARGDSAWMLVSSAFVMLMVPGLALFYGGMVRRKNVLATLMQSMAALAVVGVYWIAFGYGLAFGPSKISAPAILGEGGLVGWSWGLFFLNGVGTADKLPGYNIPVYLHVMFQGMFAIITPALISGAIAERIRFWPFCIFMLLWVTFVYCPLAHMVWAFDWFLETSDGTMYYGTGLNAIGFLGKMGALDFAGGTVVHIAAGMAGLACCLVLRRRIGYPDHPMPPNGMVLTVAGAALLWFGWFGFNGGSSVMSNALAVSAFSATQVAAAAAGLSWIVAEWLAKGKPTALGLASGIVAGLVAVTPASGFVTMTGGIIIGLLAGVICFGAVHLKGIFGYDDSLDAFGVHGVGGFLGAVLTGFLCTSAVNGVAGTAPASDGFFSLPAMKPTAERLTKEAEAIKAKDLPAAEKELADAKAGGKSGDDLKPFQGKIDTLTAAADARTAEATRLTDKLKSYEEGKKTALSQVMIQLYAAGFSAVFAFVLSAALAVAVQAMTLGNFTTSEQEETDGLDLTEHGEVGFDYGPGSEGLAVSKTSEPRAAVSPRDGAGTFSVVVEGADAPGLAKAWSGLCVPNATPDPDFAAVYPHFTTVSGNKFRFRGGDSKAVSASLQRLFQKVLRSPVQVRVEG